MLRRLLSGRLPERDSRRRSVAVPAAYDRQTSAEVAFDACDYFVDDAPNQDASERSRLSRHACLREAVSSGDVSTLRSLLEKLGNEAALLVNLAPGGANTLLFIACEGGYLEVVKTLLVAGADGRLHPVTRYSPLYAACHQGHSSIVGVVLDCYPQLVQQETVERWLPIHAACINGHAAVVKQLLDFPYPESALNTYTDESGAWQYGAAFDVNHEDVDGRTPLYIASTLGNMTVLDTLLEHRVRAKPIVQIKPKDGVTVERPAPLATDSRPTPEEDLLSPTRRRISDGIQSIMSKLTRNNSAQDEEPAENNGTLVRCVKVGGTWGASCVCIAIRGGHTTIAERLLKAGADPNAPVCLPAHQSTQKAADRDAGTPRLDRLARTNRSSRARSSSAPPARRLQPASQQLQYGANGQAGSQAPLVLAARARDHRLLALLLKYGAVDTNNCAIREAAENRDEHMVATLLSVKAYPDPEHKINKKGMSESVCVSEAKPRNSSLTYSAIFPSHPVMINWRQLKCAMSTVRMRWLRSAVMHVNDKLTNKSASLHAITRVDVSCNALQTLPLQILQLTSLKYLNVGQNKLERLPAPGDEELEGDEETRPPSQRANQRRGAGFRRPPTSRQTSVPLAAHYTCPVLEELYLQDNRLEDLPPALFSLPSLVTLDVSNNKLRQLPPEIWTAPKMRELNVALNLLRDLPESSWTDGRLAGEKDQRERRISSSGSVGQLSQALNQDVSRSPSIERSDEDSTVSVSVGERENCAPPLIGSRTGHVSCQEIRHQHAWLRTLEVSAEVGEVNDPSATGPTPHPAPQSALSSLNLAHNQFTAVPTSLACLAPRLTRLNMAYNSLRSMSYVTSYPVSLRQLDLSHNQISCWPSLPQLECIGGAEPSPLRCFCPGGGVGDSSGNAGARRPPSGCSLRCALLSSVCPAKRHLRLDALRTLILADNLLTRIQLTTDDDGWAASGPGNTTPANSTPNTSMSSGGHDGQGHGNDDDDEWNLVPAVKTRLLFPSLSMLDISNNLLRSIPVNIHDLTNLSVFNISGNSDVSELPPQMGLLNRLWNLNTSGCSLHEPLRSMIESKKYKTMDIIGYLKSVLEDAQPYTRLKLMIVGEMGVGKTSLLGCLRKESAPHHRRRPTEHWAKRMGNKNVSTKTPKGVSMSTVGVDIGDWVYEKVTGTPSLRATRQPVTFRTWDFGGQHEYYATHQYFLSRRSLYVVVWSPCAAQQHPSPLSPLRGVLRWLRSIQARAPGAPVLIVATHYDRVNDRKLANGDTPEMLQRLIRERFINVSDADKCGLPRVLDTLEVSCKTGHNMRLLADLIYEAAYVMRPPGSKEPLLEQRVPATYLALEECVSALAADRKARHLDPVLTHDQYKIQVSQYMQHKFHRSFRDQAELHQATMFLHENGVLLHYDDATLKELYFLDPQWLCDILAHVVTVREINPFARGGIMKLDDLKHVLRSSALSGEGAGGGEQGGQPDAEEARALAVSLLNKFELALCWDGRSLIVPPLLPDTHANAVKLPLKSRHWSACRSSSTSNSPSAACLRPDPYSAGPRCLGRSDAACCLRRLVLMSYVPSGFWPRLITRMLADEQIPEVVAACYQIPEELSLDASALELNGSWQLWQTGLRLMYGEIVLLTVREAAPSSNYDDFLLDGCAWDGYEQADDYRNIRFRLKQDGVWCDVDMPTSAILEIQLPSEMLIIKRPVYDENEQPIGYQNITVEPNPESVAKLLAVSSDHVDLLLEDWYPTLGTRFVHTSEGRCLVTRLVPCPLCLRECLCAPLPPPHLTDTPANGAPHPDPHTEDVNDLHSRLDAMLKRPESRSRPSLESCASDKDSGVGADSTESSRMPSVEGLRAELRLELKSEALRVQRKPLSYGWTVEECVLVACGGPQTAQVHPPNSNPFSVEMSDAVPCVICPAHGPSPLTSVAPDCILSDVPASRRAYRREITPRRLLGRGAFGLVFAADWRPQGEATRPVALKVLQPVPPGPGASDGAVAAYKAWWGRWWREGEACAIRAHSSARQELAVLTTLSHTNVLPLLAVCARPLALLLELAPMGALDSLLRAYRSQGTRTGARAARALALQAARALEYLHVRRVVYRDLKAENVLVWKLPDPSSADDAELSADPIPVHIKLADYGISRLTLPSGTKGFGGTEGFMAPEIMRYNGEEEYTEKVDCFSYGMYMYEVMTLRQPFEGHEAVKEAILDGGRPPLSYRDTAYPCYMLDTMSSCWSTAPEQRPSASQLVSIASAPEFSRLQDVCTLGNIGQGVGGCAVAPHVSLDTIAGEGVSGWEVWWCCNGLVGATSSVDGRCHLLPTTTDGLLRHNSFKLASPLKVDLAVTPTCACVVNSFIWIGDSDGWLHAFDLLDCRCVWRCATVMAVCGTTSSSITDAGGVASLLHMASLDRVAVAMANGRLFLVRSSGPGCEADGDFVLTELGAATALYSLAGLSISDKWEVWCGGDDGRVWCYTVGPMGVEEARDLQHPPLTQSTSSHAAKSSVSRLSAYASSKNGHDQFVFSYIEPGCVVYQWRVGSAEVRAKLDCSKLVPCSESLKSISIEEHLSPAHCQVTALCTLGEDVYVGTAWGCIIVAEASSLRPITIFRPHDSQVLGLVSLVGNNQNSPPMLASLGRGYRNLLARYTDTHQNQSDSSNAQTAYCLLWRTHNWAAD